MKVETLVAILFLIITLILALFIYWLAIGYIKIYEFEGNSMYPTIRDGQTCVCVVTEDYNVGDIVVYNATWVNKLICHRIIAEYVIGGKEYYILKGDNNWIPDPVPVPEERVICEVVWWY